MSDDQDDQAEQISETKHSLQELAASEVILLSYQLPTRGRGIG